MMVNDINASGAVDRVPMLEMYGKNSYIGDVWCECDLETGGVWCNCACAHSYVFSRAQGATSAVVR